MSSITHEWCIHAQVTISARAPPSDESAPPPPPGYGFQRGDITISARAPPSDGSVPPPPPTGYGFQRGDITISARAPPPDESVPPPPPTGYGFQRGDITFTTRPPRASQRFYDSGYNSEHLGTYNSLPGRGRTQQAYSRRCKSTCSITLSEPPVQECDRSPLDTRRAANYTSVQEAGDRSPQDARRAANYTSVQEAGDRSPQDVRRAANYTSGTVCDACGGDRRRAANYTSVQEAGEACEACGGDRSPQDVRRAANYTSGTVCDACGGDRSPLDARRAANYTSHFCTRVPDRKVKSQDVASQTLACDVEDKKRRAGYDSRRRTDTDLLSLPASTNKPASRLSRSPARLTGKSPLLNRSVKSSSRSPDSASAGHRPRTVHIDVYCTGSDASESSSDSSDSSTTPQTVFESADVRVVHTRAGRGALPQALQREPSLTADLPTRLQSGSFKLDSAKQRQTSRGYDSDDGLSSQYPSRLSSTSYVASSSTMSSSCKDTMTEGYDPSSCKDTVTEGYDSSSCKDTVTEGYDSSSCKDTMTEGYDSSSCKDTVTDMSVAASDSFEYADSMDRLRIKEREHEWADAKTWKSPEAERRHLLQQQKLKEFLEKRLVTGAFPLWKAEKTDDSDDDDDDETGDAWSFGSSRVQLKREDTVRQAAPREPSRLSGLAAPFTSRLGVRTDQLSRAERFGTIVGVFRKPGHHVGPARNPACECAHCRSFRDEEAFRGRARSLDMTSAEDWKTDLQEQLNRKRAQTPAQDHWDDSTAV